MGGGTFKTQGWLPGHGYRSGAARIHDLVLEGRITPAEGALLLELRRDIRGARLRVRIRRFLARAWSRLKGQG